MMPTVLLLILNMLLFLWWIQRSDYFEKRLPSRNKLIVFFLIRIGFAFFLGWYSFRYHPGSDYVVLHNESVSGKQAFLQDPAGFWRELLYSPYENRYGGFMQGVGSFWHDLKYNLLVKVLSLVNLISNESYYVNALLLNMGGFLSSCLLYRVFNHLLPDHSRASQFGCFLLPSTLYYTSGVHKDQLIFMGVCFMVYAGYFLLHDHLKPRRVVLFLSGLFLLMIFRSYLAILLIVMFGLYAVYRSRINRIWTLAITISLLVISCALDQWTGYGPMHWIVQRQAEFSSLPKAHSQLPAFILEPSVGRFMQTAPRALVYGLCSPPAFMQFRLTDWLFALEHTGYLLLLIFSLYRLASGKQKPLPPFAIFFIGLFFALALLSGWIVPNYYSIIRYKSVLLPLFVLPILHVCIPKNNSY